MRRSLRARLTLLFATVTSALIALLGLFLDYSLSSQLAAREREQLQGRLELLRRKLGEVESRAALQGSVERVFDVFVGHPELRLDVLARSGAPVVELSGFPWPAELLSRAASREEAESVAADNGQPYRVLVAPAHLAGREGETLIVALAQSRAENSRVLARFRATIVLACVLGSLAAGGLGYMAASRGLAPLRRMVRAAGRTSMERLGERLDAADAPREMRELAESFNAMLDRLEVSFRRLSEFSSDLAHELRTPLNSLMLHAQFALDRPRGAEELRGVLASGLEELERMSRMVNDMLFLAKADHAQLLLERRTFALGEEVLKVFDYFEPLAAERGVRLEREGDVRLRADRAMIRRMLANLVSNAVRHAESGSAVRVRLSEAGGGVAVEVANRGPDIPQETAQRLFDRFYRGETSRTAEGTGLGLAIVKSIVELHGGRATVRSGGGETVFRAAFGPDGLAGAG